MEITIRGKKYDITSKKVLLALQNSDPQRIATYSVEIDGKRYPIKQILAKTLKISPMEFSSMRAYQILQDLGFKILTK